MDVKTNQTTNLREKELPKQLSRKAQLRTAKILPP